MNDLRPNERATLEIGWRAAELDARKRTGSNADNQ